MSDDSGVFEALKPKKQTWKPWTEVQEISQKVKMTPADDTAINEER